MIATKSRTFVTTARERFPRWHEIEIFREGKVYQVTVRYRTQKTNEEPWERRLATMIPDRVTAFLQSIKPHQGVIGWPDLPHYAERNVRLYKRMRLYWEEAVCAALGAWPDVFAEQDSSAAGGNQATLWRSGANPITIGYLRQVKGTGTFNPKRTGGRHYDLQLFHLSDGRWLVSLELIPSKEFLEPSRFHVRDGDSIEDLDAIVRSWNVEDDVLGFPPFPEYEFSQQELITRLTRYLGKTWAFCLKGISHGAL